MARGDGDDAALDRAEIRLLGPLRVRRADGEVVEAARWRTSQTADLLRLLALHVEEPVSVDFLVDALWPRADDKRGRASLRTAASGIRKVLGEDCVQRSMGGLLLTGVWVDAAAFRSLAHEARRQLVTGDLAACVTTTREAEVLYLGEFRSHHDGTEWALRARDDLAAVFRAMIADAAEAAAELGWWHDAVDLAERVLAVEPCSERAYRALMRGQRGLGETALALKTYDRCRRVLSDELGADPSPDSHALYIEVLADQPHVPPPPPFSGRGHELAWLRERALEPGTTGRPVLVCVVGEPGSGKSRLVQHALGAAGVPLRVITCTPSSRPSLRALVPDLTAPTTVVLDDAHLLGPDAVSGLVDELAGLQAPVGLVAVGRPSWRDEDVAALTAAAGAGSNVLWVPVLASDEVAELCAVHLGGRVSPQLVARVLAETGGNPGAVVQLVRDWAASGRVAATSRGLVLLGGPGPVGGPDDGPAPWRQLLTVALDRLSSEAMEVLQVVAVLDRPVTAELLVPLVEHPWPDDVADGAAWMRTLLDGLYDLRLLSHGDHGLVLRDPLLRDSVLAWARPSARRRLHRRVAERAHITPAERAEHWQQAGEPQLARAGMMDAAAEALDAQQHERARLHFSRLCRVSEYGDAAPSDRVELYEKWGDAAALLGRAHEARAAYDAGAAIAAAHGLADEARLRARRDRVVQHGPAATAASPETAAVQTSEAATTEAATAAVEPATVVPVPVEPAPVEPAPAEPPIAAPAPHAWEPAAAASALGYPDVQRDLDVTADRLHQAVVEADALGVPRDQALARDALVRQVCVPQRQLRVARRWSRQALAQVDDPGVFSWVFAGGCLPNAVLGDALAVEPGLRRSAGLAGDWAPPGDDGPTLAAVRCLVAHDLGRPDLTALRTAALADPSRHQWLAIRVATERDELVVAQAADAAPTPRDASPVVRELRLAASAALANKLGDLARAHALLLEVLAVADRTGATLVVPEAIGRLIMLEAHTDLAAARARFDAFEAVVGTETWLPRETVLRLLARAAVRQAAGRPDDAAEAAAAAADVAESAGLVLTAATCHRHRATHLAAAGRGAEARLAAAAAARWHRSAFSAPAAEIGPGSHPADGARRERRQQTTARGTAPERRRPTVDRRLATASGSGELPWSPFERDEDLADL